MAYWLAKKFMHTSITLRFGVAFVFVLTLTGCTKRDMPWPSSSMEPTIKKGEVISLDFAAYSGSFPNRWDVVVFDSPIQKGHQWIGRVVGLPEETIDIRSGSVVIDGRPEVLPAHLSLGGYELPKEDLTPGAPRPVSFPYKIPAGGYFVLGDNVSNSLDSRYWGHLNRSDIIGKVPGK